MKIYNQVLYALLCIGVLGATSVYAQNPSGDLRLEILSAYNFVVDSNVESPSTYAPESAYIGVKIWNDGSNDLTDVYAYIGNYTNSGSAHPAYTPAGRMRLWWGRWMVMSLL